MSGADDNQQDKPHDPTPQKLRKAREKGDIARSADLNVAAGYAGLVLAATAAGGPALTGFGQALMVLLDQPDRLAPLVFEANPAPVTGAIMISAIRPLTPFFAIPAVACLLSLLAQRGIVLAPSKIKPKLSRISPVSNASNKFGRSGLFEFFKSFSKLLLYSILLGAFLRSRLPQILAVAGDDAQMAVVTLARLSVEILFLVLLIAAGIGALDALWQHADYRRRNRMSHKELTDETKDSEGDPHIKQQRRQRGQEIALTRMIADVPDADVVVVNPTHFAVALQWSRQPGSAPVCVAKGVDEVAATIRRKAEEAAVPIHSDPPTARALFATVDLGQEIPEEHYQAAAAAIRFADRMRQRAKEGVQP